MPEPLRVAIAEDHYLVREGLRALLEDSGEVQVIATVSTAVAPTPRTHRHLAGSRVGHRRVFPLESAVEKHVSAIFAKLGEAREPHVHRRVAAVLAFLQETR